MISKEQILEAAGLVFSQMGYSQSTIQDIATAAGIGKGTVYSYFESKPEIFVECGGVTSQSHFFYTRNQVI